MCAVQVQCTLRLEPSSGAEYHKRQTQSQASNSTPAHTHQIQHMQATTPQPDPTNTKQHVQ